MIKLLTLNKGQKLLFTDKLYHHSKKDVIFTFTDGVNVITGRNGSGKSVLLKIIKTHCAIGEDSSYPRMFKPFTLHGWFDDNWKTIPDVISDNLKKLEFPKSKLDWDGSMVHYLTPEFFNPHDIWTRIDSPFPQGKELFSGIEAIDSLYNNNKISKGENCIHLLNKLYNLHTEYDQDLKNVNDMWLKANNIFQSWIKIFPKDGKPTLLIDELDNHLDLDNQKLYWDYINNLTKLWQVIVVSHSIFSFKQKNVNHIPLDKEYFENVNKL